jgi:hypothetical protein
MCSISLSLELMFQVPNSNTNTIFSRLIVNDTDTDVHERRYRITLILNNYTDLVPTILCEMACMTCKTLAMQFKIGRNCGAGSWRCLFFGRGSAEWRTCRFPC